MITRIEVDGFKSLRDFAVDLEPLTVFIGPNSAGKSNILEAIALLSRLTRMPIVEAFKGGRGRTIDQFTRTGSTNVKSIRFAVEFLEYGAYPAADKFQSRFRYELTIERRETKRGAEQLVVVDERVNAMRSDGDTWVMNHPEYVHWAHYQRAGENYFTTLRDAQSPMQRIVTMPGSWAQEISVPRDHTTLYTIAPAFQLHLPLCNTMEAFRTLYVDSLRLGMPSERTDLVELAPDASNLPTILAELPDSALGAVRANLAMLVPGIASFDIVDDGDDFHIEFELSGGERVPARLVSNGTLRLLALLTAIYMEPRPPILGIEEPENGIFPGRIRLLLEKLRQIAAEDTTAYVQQRWENARQSMSIVQGINVNHLPTQILVTTHSTVILSALLSQSQHLRFVDMVRRNGERVTRARTVGPVKSPQDGRFVITPGEIEAILDAAHGEAAE
jgi:predicted ATPase